MAPKMSTYSQDSLPDSINVPMEAENVGEITYKCRGKTNAPRHDQMGVCWPQRGAE